VLQPDRPKYNTAHAHCMPDTQSYRRTLKMYNKYFFSTAKMVTRTLFVVTLHIYGPPILLSVKRVSTTCNQQPLTLSVPN
jgi:hypothetical protein